MHLMLRSSHSCNQILSAVIFLVAVVSKMSEVVRIWVFSLGYGGAIASGIDVA